MNVYVVVRLMLEVIESKSFFEKHHHTINLFFGCVLSRALFVFEFECCEKLISVIVIAYSIALLYSLV